MLGGEDDKVKKVKKVKNRRCEEKNVWKLENMKMQNDNNRKCEAVKMKKCEDEKIRRCADVKMFEDVQSKPPLLEEPFAQTLPGIKKGI